MFIRSRTHSYVKQLFLPSSSFHTSLAIPITAGRVVRPALALSRDATLRRSSKIKMKVLGYPHGLSWHRGVSNIAAGIQTVDLLERYRGLVALGEIEYDEDQVRVIMQVSILLRLFFFIPIGDTSYSDRSSEDYIESWLTMHRLPCPHISTPYLRTVPPRVMIVLNYPGGRHLLMQSTTSNQTLQHGPSCA
jgi:hypothetical protein